MYNLVGKFLVRCRYFDNFFVFDVFNGIFDNILIFICGDIFLEIELMVFIIVFLLGFDLLKICLL